jgi:hypothetical protein
VKKIIKIKISKFLVIKITQNSIYVLTLGLKIIKLPSMNPRHQGLSKNTKTLYPNFPKNCNFDFVEISLKVLFNNTCILGLNITKSPWCTSTHQGPSNGTKELGEGGGGVMGCCLGEILTS